MLLDFIFGPIFSGLVYLFDFALSVFPSIDFSFDPSVIAGIEIVFRYVGFILPMDTVAAILTISFLLTSGQIVWSVILRILHLIT